MEYLTIALPKGKLFDRSVKVLAKVGCVPLSFSIQRKQT